MVPQNLQNKVQILEKGKVPFQPHPLFFSSPVHPTTHCYSGQCAQNTMKLFYSFVPLLVVSFAWYLLPPVYICPNQSHIFSVCPSRSVLHSSPALCAGRLTCNGLHQLAVLLSGFWLVLDNWRTEESNQSILLSALFAMAKGWMCLSPVGALL